MEVLFRFQDTLLKSVDNSFRRYLHPKINWKQRMIGIRGPRGVGKTTLILQRLKFDLGPEARKALYITADHTWFYNHTLLDTATEWYQLGGRILYIDEVHKYPLWSRELKNIYDGLPEMQVVFSASSALDIYRGEADLSRRVISYRLGGLSLREYLVFEGGHAFETFSFKDIISRHREISHDIIDQLNILPSFHNYLKIGYLPIIAEGENEYLPRLEQIINAIVDTDLAHINTYNSGTAVKVKRLLSVIAESSPFKPNISALSRKLDLHREAVYEFIYQLVEARLLNLISAEGKGVSRLQKPDKIFLENTNLCYAMQAFPDKGALRETFLMNQLVNAGNVPTSPGKGGFLINGINIEVGGRSKTARQVRDTENYLVAADDIEAGFGSKVPLWLFGFLY